LPTPGIDRSREPVHLPAIDLGLLLVEAVDNVSEKALELERDFPLAYGELGLAPL
jgi:hypothetical protein